MQQPIIHFSRRVLRVVWSRMFITLTVVGNGLIGLSGYAFYLLERGANPRVTRFLDALWWAFATATTTGYGDITPVTDLGKVLSIFLMLAGLALFSMYTALFAEAVLVLDTRDKYQDQD